MKSLVTNIRSSRGINQIRRQVVCSYSASFMYFNILLGPNKIDGHSVRINEIHGYAYRSCASTATAPSRCTTRIPELTRPKIVCLLSRYGVGPNVMKN